MKLPRINTYVCEYGCYTVTVDVDIGVTPFMLKCRAKSTPTRPINKKFLDKNGECIGKARSCFYPKIEKPASIEDPAWQWEKQSESSYKYESERYSVSIDEVKQAYKDDKNILILVPRTDREPIYHD